MLAIVATQTPVPPAPPAPSAPVQSALPVVTTRDLTGQSLTAQEVSALLARRKMLSDQVSSATSRRKEVAAQLRTATGADRTGLEQRLGVLDARIARLEADIDETGRILSSPGVAYRAEQQRPGFFLGPNNTGFRENGGLLMALLIIFVLFPIAFSIARGVWKRSSRQPAALPAGTTERLERMEQAIEAVAIEVERISEGQRFVTRLLSEGAAAMPQLKAGAKIEVGARSERTPI